MNLDKNSSLEIKNPTPKTSKNVVLAVVFGVVSLGVITVASIYVWQEIGDVALGVHGWIALIAGSVATLILGGGLMALSFYSSRSGHDDAAQQEGNEQESDKSE